jgi:hypothetical protein
VYILHHLSCYPLGWNIPYSPFVFVCAENISKKSYGEVQARHFMSSIFCLFALLFSRQIQQ